MRANARLLIFVQPHTLRNWPGSILIVPKQQPRQNRQTTSRTVMSRTAMGGGNVKGLLYCQGELPFTLKKGTCRKGTGKKPEWSSKHISVSFRQRHSALPSCADFTISAPLQRVFSPSSASDLCAVHLCTFQLRESLALRVLRVSPLVTMFAFDRSFIPIRRTNSPGVGITYALFFSFFFFCSSR